jgi:LCP family protein required for cell wall assembly
MENEKNTDKTNLKLSNPLVLALLVAFAIAAILTAYLTFIAVRDFVTSWEITGLPGVSITDATPTPASPGAVAIEQPLQAIGGPTPVPWDGAARVTLLIMGLDYRDWQAGEGPPRTDTMILFTLDPLSQTAGVLSVPRDLWVAIPGFEYGKINTAYQLGEAYKLPGGGPELAMKTVEELLGVPIDYYAQIDFNAFIKFIDDIGGVKLDIKEPIRVDPLGDNNSKKLKPGIQTLNGELTLAYARARKTEGGDFDRSQRQQVVIQALRNRMLEKDNLVNVIAKAPTLYQDLSSGIHTNLSLEQVIKLAWFAKQIPDDKIKYGIIGPDQVNFFKSPDGLDALKPLPDQIRLLRDEILTESGPPSPVVTNLSPGELMQAEGAKVEVLNGSTTNGLAASTTDYLKTQNVNVANTGNAESLFTNTTIYDYTGKPYTVKFLVDLMGISPTRIYSRYDPTKPVDLSVIVGTDWAAKIPAP